MKVVFLDFDGVLNDSQTQPEFGIEAKFVDRLNVLIEKTGAKVVISSSWRLYGLLQCSLILENAGFKGEVIGLTPERVREWGKQGPPRGLEIQAWLDAHPEVEKFVILDDEADMEHLLPFLVKTSMVTGLEDHHVALAVAVLGLEE